jgi:hypothetical protein
LLHSLFPEDAVADGAFLFWWLEFYKYPVANGAPANPWVKFAEWNPYLICGHRKT